MFGQNQCSLLKKSLKQSDNHKPLIEEAQCNGQKKKDKMTNNDLLNSTQKTKDWETQTPQKKKAESTTQN